MRIAVGGIWAECLELSKIHLKKDDFKAEVGKELIDRWTSFTEADVEFVPLTFYRALPGGFLEKDDFRSMENNILFKLEEAENIDAVIFELHGALGVVGMSDPEANFLSLARDIVGKNMIIGLAMDLHGSVSESLFSLSDVITCNRKSPHTDDIDVRRRIVALVMRAYEDGKPKKYMVSANMTFSGELTSTDNSPAKEIWGALEKEPNMSVDLFVGYPWSSDPRHKVCAVGYGSPTYLDIDAVKAPVDALIEHRGEFKFNSKLLTLPISEAFFEEPDRFPIFLSDVADNTGAGSEGSATDVLDSLYRTLRKIDLNVLVAPICLMDDFTDYRIGDFYRASPACVGKIEKKLRFTSGLTLLVLEQHGFTIVVSDQRCQFGDEEDFAAIGIDLNDFDVVVLKMGYLEPYPASLAKTHRLVLGHGSVNPNLCEVQKQLGTDKSEIWVPGKKGIEIYKSCICG